MADGRRTRWVAHDVYFLDDPLGTDIFDRFGAAGVALWHGFIAACKKNHVEGQVSFSTEPEALAVFGLPGMPLVDPDGEPFSLEAFFKLLGDHKVTRRSRRGRRVQVVCTRWTRWQQAARRHRKAERQSGDRDDTDEQNRRSEAGNTGTVEAQSGHDVGRKQAQMTDTDTDINPTSDVADATPHTEFSEDVRNLTRQLAQAVKANGFKIPSRGTKANGKWLVEMDRLLRLDGADPAEVASVIGWATADEFWRANIQSVPTLRKQYPRLRLRMADDDSVQAVTSGRPRVCDDCGVEYTPRFFGDAPMPHGCDQGDVA